MSKVTTPENYTADSELESRIWLAYYKAIASRKPEDWTEFSSLVRQRQPVYLAGGANDRQAN